MLAVIALTLLAGSEALRGRSSIDLNVNTDDGSYTITVSGSKWFRSGPTSVHANGAWMTTEDGSLKLMNHSNYTGTDFWGPFNATVLEWQGKSNVTFLSSFRTYENFPMIAFVQSYPNGANNTQAPDKDEIMSSFPAVVIEGDKGTFGATTYHDHGGETGSTTTVDWTLAASLPGGDDGGPVAVFDKDMQNAVVMSPASQFMGASQSVWEGMDKKSHYLSFGLLGTATEIPKGFEYETVFYAGNGVNDAYKEWGRLMRKRYGKTDAFREADFANNYIGYWTDNGACYHYYPGEVNYENSILQVYEAAMQNNIPFKYLQLDSWWYFKGQHGGVKNWTAMPSVFPHGIPYLYNKTGWPIFAHHRWWSPEADDAKQNGGKFDFIVEDRMALPVSQDCWDNLMKTAKRDWGLFVYEQDAMSKASNDLKAMRENVTLGRTWLLQMGQAAQRYGLTIQYCMPYPRHLLQTFEIPSVTQSRFSADYHNALVNQWDIGYQAIFAEALGIAPFKDTFYTFPHQPMCANKNDEMYPRLEAFSAVYSTGPVGPGDRYNLTDRSIVMLTCAEDGRILKPTKPMRAINAMFIQAAFGAGGPNGSVWTTHTKIGNLQWHHIFSVEMVSAFDFTPDDLLDLHQEPNDDGVRLFSEQSWISYPHNMTSPPQPFDTSHPLKLPLCEKWDFGLYHVAPVFPNGWVVLGEMAKLVPISEKRIQSVAETETSVHVQLVGSVGEKVTISFWMPAPSNSSDGKVIEVTCAVLTNGFVTMSVPDGTCM